MMNRKVTVYIIFALMLSIVVFGLAQAATSNIDATHKWAWSESSGWLNFKANHGGVTVYGDHLEGYVWAENLGWIRLGTFTGGGSHTYSNSSASDYGVNRDSSGNLTGYGWSETAGWINFDPTGSEQVKVDTAGNFSGYAWGENVGWIKLAGATYKVNSSPLLVNHYTYLPFVSKK